MAGGVLVGIGVEVGGAGVGVSVGEGTVGVAVGAAVAVGVAGRQPKAQAAPIKRKNKMQSGRRLVVRSVFNV